MVVGGPTVQNLEHSQNRGFSFHPQSDSSLNWQLKNWCIFFGPVLFSQELSCRKGLQRKNLFKVFFEEDQFY